jgi:pyridoxine 5-phosphate synthase
VNAGHGLDYTNVQEIAKIEHINELNIGHSIIAESIFLGLSEAIKKMKISIKSVK